VWLDARNVAGWHCQRMSEVTATRLAAFRPHFSEVFKNLTDDSFLPLFCSEMQSCNGESCKIASAMQTQFLIITFELITLNYQILHPYQFDEHVVVSQPRERSKIFL
jgi:hypothetical protein